MTELITPFLISIGLLFVIGFICLIVKREIIRLLMGIEIMFNAANIAFIVFSTQQTGFIDPYLKNGKSKSTELYESRKNVVNTMIVAAKII